MKLFSSFLCVVVFLLGFVFLFSFIVFACPSACHSLLLPYSLVPVQFYHCQEPLGSHSQHAQHSYVMCCTAYELLDSRVSVPMWDLWDRL